VVLDIEQAFDRVWHEGLLYKLKNILPSTYYLIIKSYLTDRYFQVCFSNSFSQIFPFHAGVPQGSILGPTLYTIYSADIPTCPNTTLLTFADDTAILSNHANVQIAVDNLQSHLQLLEGWHTKWKLKINNTKSVHITFTLNKTMASPVFFNGSPIPVADTVRYLGLYLDKRLTWNPHTRLKRTELKRRFHQTYRLLGRHSKLSLTNKLLLYKTVLRPIWTYGLELWGSAKPSNIKKIQSMQSKILRVITNSPFYISNLTLHTDLNIPFVSNLALSRYKAFHSRLLSHPNPHVHSIASPNLPDNPTRRLKRRWPRDLLTE